MTIFCFEVFSVTIVHHSCEIIQVLHHIQSQERDQESMIKKLCRSDSM